ncbi:MAG: WecB/TagA/CpsF family glycosyltransferase [Cyanobacteria bacterium J06635_15]
MTNKVAPRWIRESGLEWVYQLCQAQQRLWKRYWKTLPSSIRLVFQRVFIKEPRQQANKVSR